VAGVRKLLIEAYLVDVQQLLHTSTEFILGLCSGRHDRLLVSQYFAGY